MWLHTTFGFFSVVQATGDPQTVLVRGRVKTDLEHLKRVYLPDAGPITRDDTRDYRYRCVVRKLDLASAMQDMVMDIDYGNFKSEVAKAQGWDREHIYARTWSVNLELEKLDDAQQAAARARPSKRQQKRATKRQDQPLTIRRKRGAWKAMVQA